MNKKRILIIIMVIYLFSVLWITLLNRQCSERRAMLVPFWEIRELFTSKRKLYWAWQIIGNFIMLMPLGFLLPLYHKRFNQMKAIFIIALGFSLSIEITQYFTGRGLCEFDDVFNNTSGACAGWIIFRKIYILINK